LSQNRSSFKKIKEVAMKKYCGRVRRLCEVGHPVNKNQRPKDVALLLAAHPPQFERPTMMDE